MTGNVELQQDRGKQSLKCLCKKMAEQGLADTAKITKERLDRAMIAHVPYSLGT